MLKLRSTIESTPAAALGLGQKTLQEATSALDSTVSIEVSASHGHAVPRRCCFDLPGLHGLANPLLIPAERFHLHMFLHVAVVEGNPTNVGVSLSIRGAFGNCFVGIHVDLDVSVGSFNIDAAEG